MRETDEQQQYDSDRIECYSHMCMYVCMCIAIICHRTASADFQHKKHALQTLLSEIREDVDRLNDQRKKLGEEGRDTITIRLASENTHRLKQATELLQELRKQQDKDEKRGKGSKRKLSEKELAERREMVILIGNQLQQLVRDNQRSKALENPEDAAMQDRVERRKAEQEARTREKREERRRARKAGRKGADAAIDEDDFKEVGPRSEQEQAFEQQVQQNREQQDKMLEEISGVLTDLHELAVTANKQLAVQSAMIDEIDKQMDKSVHIHTHTQRERESL